MPVRLIGFIVFILIIFAFIGFNLDNRTDINIWITEKGHYEDVSVIIVVFFAYLFGLFSTLPFWFTRARSKRNKLKLAKNQKQELIADESFASTPGNDGIYDKPSEQKNGKVKSRRPLIKKKKRTLEEKNS